MNCFKRLQRFLAGVITITFFVTNTLTPAPVAYAQNVESSAFISSLKIPEAFGKVTDVFRGASESPVLLHIQEAHANFDAQKNIKNILEHLSKDYGVKLILVEGAGGKLQPGLLKFFPGNAVLQEAVTEKLMQAGELTGAEAMLIDSEDKKIEGWGIENADAYAENREDYRKVYKGRKLAESFLDNFYRHWQKSSDQALNKSLSEFLDRESAFEEERLPLQEWLAFLKTAILRDLELDLDDVREQMDWPAVVRYFRLKKIDSQIDPARSQKEQNAFLEDLRARKIPALLLQELTELLNQKNAGGLPVHKTRFAFEKLMDLLPKDYSFDAYPVFKLHLQQLVLLSELQGESLQEEIKALTRKMTADLIKTEQEQKLVEALHHYRLLKKLFNRDLSRQEFLELQSQKITPERMAGAPELHPSQLSLIASLFESATRFYQGAIAREEHMMTRAREIMAERKEMKAVIITGGFHTVGLKQKITGSGISYIGISPAIGEITSDSEKNYLTALLGSEALSKSKIAPEVITQPSFFKAVSPRFWRRELSVRLVRVRDIVRQTVASFQGKVAENMDGVDAGIRNLIVSVAGVSAQLQRVPVAARAELRGSKDWERVGKTLKVLMDIQRSPLGLEYGAAAQRHKETLNQSDWTLEQLAGAEQFIRDVGWKNARSEVREGQVSDLGLQTIELPNFFTLLNDSENELGIKFAKLETPHQKDGPFIGHYTLVFSRRGNGEKKLGSARLVFSNQESSGLFQLDPAASVFNLNTLGKTPEVQAAIAHWREVYTANPLQRFMEPSVARSEMRKESDARPASEIEQELLEVNRQISETLPMPWNVVPKHLEEKRQELKEELKSATSRSEVRSWITENTPRVAANHVYSRQFEAGYPMHVLKKIEELFDAYRAGEISQTTLTGGLGALLPDLFEAWAAIGMNVTGIHPLWNFIKNKPVKGLDDKGQRIFFGELVKKAMELTPIEFQVKTIRNGAPTTVFLRVYKTYYQEHKSPQYYLDGYTKTANGKEEPFFDEVYDDTGKRETHMAVFQEASERLIQILEKDPDPGNCIIIDHEVFVSLPQIFLKKAKRMTLNHTVFRPGLFEAQEGNFNLFRFPEWLRSVIAHDGKISLADFTAEVYDLITGVNLVEHLPALLKNIFRAAWHRVKGFYDQVKKIRSTNGVFLPRWQSDARRLLIEHYKKEINFLPPGNGLPPASNDREFFEELDKHEDLREQFKARNEWVMAADAAEFLIWLENKTGFYGSQEWLGNTFKDYKKAEGMNDVVLGERLKGLRDLLHRAAQENKPEDWARLEAEFSKVRDTILAEPIVSNIRRQVPYKGPDKYEEVLVEKILGRISVAAEEAAEAAGISAARSGKASRPFDSLFQSWKGFRKDTDNENENSRKQFETVRTRLKDQDAVEEVRRSICRVLIGGRTFDEPDAYERFLYIQFLAELLGLEDRIAALEDYTYYEAQIIFKGVQGSVMLSDKDLEASATSMMKTMTNGGEVIGPFAGSNPEIWVIRDEEAGKNVDVLNEKGEPAFEFKTLREKLHNGEWQLLNGVYVDYDESEKSAQEGGGWRPSARSLLEALKTVKALRQDPETRRERMYQSVANAWRVDMVVGQAMGHALLLENMLREVEEREAMFSQLNYSTSDYAVPVKVPDFEWEGISGRRKHSASGMGLFGMFKSFRELKTWQNQVLRKQSDGSIRKVYDPATRGIEAQNSIKHHAYYGDIFRYLKRDVLNRLSSGLDPFKRQIEALALRAETSDEKERVVLNLEAMDLTEMLLIRMAGDWFERYMKASPAEAAILAQQLAKGVRANYQPWAEYLVRHLNGHSDATALMTHNNKIASFVFAPQGSQPVLVNLNFGAPVKEEQEKKSKIFKARTQVFIEDAAFQKLVNNTPEAQIFQVREPQLGKNYRIHAKQNPVTVLGIGVPMPLGIEVLELQPIASSLLSSSLLEPVRLQEEVDASPLKQLIRESQESFASHPEGAPVGDPLFKQLLESKASHEAAEATALFGDKIRLNMTLIGLFRPDLLNTSRVSSWDPEFHAKLNRVVTVLSSEAGIDLPNTSRNKFYVLDASHKSSLVIVKKNEAGDVFAAAFQLDASAREVAEDGKVGTQVSTTGLDQIFEPGASYQVNDLMEGVNYGSRDDFLQGWNIRVPFGGSADRVQLLWLKKEKAPASLPEGGSYRSEIREEKAWPKQEPQKIAVVGTGFVGTTKAVLLVTDWGHDVAAVDVVQAKAEALNKAELPFSALLLPELLKEGIQSGRLQFTTDYSKALEGREIIFLAVQSPQSETGHSDTFYVEDAVRQIARVTKPGERKIIVGKSTVPPVTTVAKMKQSIEQVRAERMRDALIGKLEDLLKDETLTADQINALLGLKKEFEGRREAIRDAERDYGLAIQKMKEDPSALKEKEAVVRGVLRPESADVQRDLEGVKEIAGDSLSRQWKLDEVLDQPIMIEIAWEPEFLREGFEVEDDRGLANRVVVGASSPDLAERIASIYGDFNPEDSHQRQRVPIVKTDVASAQLVKYAANGYRALKISFINFLGWISEEIGFNIEDVAAELRKDGRILGSDPENPIVRHGFLAAGLGFGGSCFPKDLAALVQIAKENGVLPGLVLDALAINDVQWRWFVEKVIVGELGDLNDKKIVVLGGAFKADTSDTRDSRSIRIVKELLKKGARVIVVDPDLKAIDALEHFDLRGASKVTYTSDISRLQNVLSDDVSGVVLATEWKQFKQIDFKRLAGSLKDQGKKLPAIFDGRNFFDDKELQALGFSYNRIGKRYDRDGQEDFQEFVDDAREFFLALRLSYINMIAELAERVGANIRDVAQGFGRDPIVGLEYLQPGIGWGGHNLRKALEDIALRVRRDLNEKAKWVEASRQSLMKKYRFPEDGSHAGHLPFISEVDSINRHQIELYVEKIKEAAGAKELEGASIAVLGLGYKQGSSSITKSRGLKLVKELLKQGAIVYATDEDTQAVTNARWIFEEIKKGESPANSPLNGDAMTWRSVPLERLHLVDTPKEAVRGTVAQVITTASNYFKEVDEIFPGAQQIRVVDGRHFFNEPEIVGLIALGGEYHAVGMPSQKPDESKEPAARSETREGADKRYSLTVIGPRGYRGGDRGSLWLPVEDNTGRKGWFQPSSAFLGQASGKGHMIWGAIEDRQEGDETPIFSDKKLLRPKGRDAKLTDFAAKAGTSPKAFIFSALERAVRVEPQGEKSFSVRLSVQITPEMIKGKQIFVHFGPYDGGMIWQDQGGVEILFNGKEGQYELHAEIDPSEAFPGKTGEFGATFFALPKRMSSEDPGFFNKRAWVGEQNIDGKFQVRSEARTEKNESSKAERALWRLTKKTLERLRLGYGWVGWADAADFYRDLSRMNEKLPQLLYFATAKQGRYWPALLSQFFAVFYAQLQTAYDLSMYGRDPRGIPVFLNGIYRDLNKFLFKVAWRVRDSESNLWKVVEMKKDLSQILVMAGLPALGSARQIADFEPTLNEKVPPQLVSRSLAENVLSEAPRPAFPVMPPEIMVWRVNAKKIGIIISGKSIFADNADELATKFDQIGVKAQRLDKKRVVVGDQTLRWNDTVALEESLRALLIGPGHAVRSEARILPVTAEFFPETRFDEVLSLTSAEEFFAYNKKSGGGLEQGVLVVTEKIMDGVIPLLAHTLNVAEAVISLLPASLAQKTAETLMQARFAAARKMLGVKTVQVGDVFILGREFALGQGFLEAARDILGDVPVAVVARDRDDVAFLERFNAALSEGQQVLITSDSAADIAAVRSELRSRVKAGRFNLQVLLYGAETLKSAFPDNMVQRITQRMLQNFLKMAGESISDRVNRMAEEFRAVARAA